jgi:cell division protein FtsQ
VSLGSGPRVLSAWLPSRRSLFAGLIVVVAAVGLYVGARETSVFAIERIEVRGTQSGVAARVRTALEPLTGSSLVAFDETAGNRRLATVPMVAQATYDRDFPHTLRVTVTAERPIALLRRGPSAWVVSANARVIRNAAQRPLRTDLPRIWLPASADPVVGATVGDDVARVIQALVAINEVRLPVPIRSVRLVEGELSITLRSGVDALLGDLSRLPLKAAVIAEILTLSTDMRSIDVSVPERAVTSTSLLEKPQVES